MVGRAPIAITGWGGSACFMLGNRGDGKGVWGQGRKRGAVLLLKDVHHNCGDLVK